VDRRDGEEIVDAAIAPQERIRRFPHVLLQIAVLDRPGEEEVT
jgi:hypothetical protein